MGTPEVVVLDTNVLVSALARPSPGSWGTSTQHTMKLPRGDIAIIDRTKLTGYCLNPHHPRGKHKARVFEAALGITARNVDELRAALVVAAATKEAQLVGSDRFGDRYLVDFEIKGSTGARVVRSLWIVPLGDSAPRFTSCYVKRR